MKKKEFAVGEVFPLGPCNPNSREDKTSVIFVEVEN